MRRIALLLAGTLALTACAGVETDSTTSTRPATLPAPSTTSQPTGPAYGFSFSPANYDADGWTGFFPVAARGGTIVTWAGDWAELDDEEGPAVTIGELAQRAGLDLMAVVGPFSDGYSIRSIEDNAADYVDRAARYAERFQPRFMTLGVEVDIPAVRDPDGFEAFVDLFANATAAVHAASPDTQVMLAFQLESMKGRRDGVFGEGIVDPTWELIDRFPDADIIAFTTYPGLIYGDPADIPDDYYAEISDRVDKPVAFIEVGWQSGEIGAAEWDSDPAEQAEAVTRILELTSELSPEPFIWSFLWDPPGIPPFDTMGLFDAGGEPESAAWDAWLEFWGR